MTPNTLLGAVAYAAVGIALFLGGLRIAIFTLPGDPWRKAIQEHSTSAALIVAAIALALGWIVASAVH